MTQLQDKDPAQFRRVLRRMSQGVQLTTRFSGIECAAHALREIGKTIAEQKLVDLQHGAGFSLLSVMDSNSKCQLCLAALGKAWEKDGCAPGHCFKSMEGCVEFAALQEVHAALEEHRKKSEALEEHHKKSDTSEEHRKKSDALEEHHKKNSSDEDQWPLLRALLQILLREGALKEKQFCVLHGHECRVHKHDEQDNQFTLHCAGTPCVDFSRRGKRKRGFGDTIVPFAIWMAQFIKSNERVGLHECTPDFPDWMILWPLREFSCRTWQMEVFKLCPSDFGIPCKRKRRYTVFWRGSAVCFDGSVADFGNLFFEPTRLKGGIFFQDGDKLPVTASKTHLQNLQVYQDERQSMMRVGRGVGPIPDICDLEQRPPFGQLDVLVPTLVTHNSMYNLTKQKLLTDMECLNVQLLPLDSPIRALCHDGRLSSASIRHVAGNSMSAVCVGSILLYMMANIRPVGKATKEFRRQLPNSRLRLGGMECLEVTESQG